MERILLSYLISWISSKKRQPLVLRGARQVGKTWIVRQLAKVCGKTCIELNFEKNPAHASLFASNDPKQILLNLSAIHHQQIDPHHCLLFLDEIQAAPQLFSKLRWFAEDCPELAVIAAGSLLEFILAEHSFSMPVGRITYAHLEPLSFEEFLLANDKKNLYDYLAAYQLRVEIPIAIHEQLNMLFKEYLLIGGLPAVVNHWSTERSLSKVSQIQNDLLTTYRDDFSKYRGRIAVEKLDEVLMAIPKMLGQKFIFSRVNPSLSSSNIKDILELLSKAKICHRVSGVSANGIPLKSEIREKYFKEIFLDTGLCSAALGLHFNSVQSAQEIILINSGGIAEQVVGQMLRTLNPPYIEPNLYYWQREEKGSSAEIDYVIQYDNQVIPIEVKAGSTGHLKSLHLFMGLKKLPLALRINADLPSKTIVKVKEPSVGTVEYVLISLPFYLVGQLYRLLQ